jgi:hypothetical protein
MSNKYTPGSRFDVHHASLPSTPGESAALALNIATQVADVKAKLNSEFKKISDVMGVLSGNVVVPAGSGGAWSMGQGGTGISLAPIDKGIVYSTPTSLAISNPTQLSWNAATKVLAAETLNLTNPLGMPFGGSNAALVAAEGGLAYSTDSALAISDPDLLSWDGTFEILYAENLQANTFLFGSPSNSALVYANVPGFPTPSTLEFTDPDEILWDNALKRFRINSGALSVGDGWHFSVIHTEHDDSGAILGIDDITVDNPSSNWIRGGAFEGRLHSTAGNYNGKIQALEGNARYYGSGTSALTGQLAGLLLGIINHGSTIISTGRGVHVDVMALTTGGYTDVTGYDIGFYFPSSGAIQNFYAFKSPDKTAFITNHWHFYGDVGGYSYLGHPLLLGDTAVGSALGRLVFKTGTTEADGISFGTDEDAKRVRVYRSADAVLTISSGLVLGTATVGSATGRLVFPTGTTIANGIEFGTDGANAVRFYRSGNQTAKLEGNLNLIVGDWGGLTITSSGSPIIYFGGTCVFDSITSGGIYFTFNYGNDNAFYVDWAKIVHCLATTEATAYNAASVLMAGGLGVAKKIITNSSIEANGDISVASGKVYKVNSTQVVGAQGAAVADASGGTVIDAECRTALNTLLARVRTHGLIAT